MPNTNLDSQPYTISVIIPTKNRVFETIRAVESVRRQTYPVTEIIVVDDGSLPQNKKQLKEKSEKLSFLLIETDGTNHPGRTRQLGLSSAQGEWISFLDSDDYWEEDKIQEQIQIIRTLRAEAICSNAKVMDSVIGEVLLLNNKSGYINKLEMFMKNPVITSSVFLKKEILENIGGFETSYFARGVEDYITWLKVSTEAKWYYDATPRIVYRNQPTISLRGDEKEYVNPHIHGLLMFIEWIPFERKKQGFAKPLFYKIVIAFAFTYGLFHG